MNNQQRQTTVSNASNLSNINTGMSNLNINQQPSTMGLVEKMVLPTKVVELPTAIHEEIRVEKVKEVQPIVNVERDFTQVIQKTQPIIDREIRSVNIQERTLDTQVLPELRMDNKGFAQAREQSTVEYLNTQAVTLEKPSIYNELDKTQIIEEIQPVIYKETIVPSVLKETVPSFQKIVEGTTYTNERLAPIDRGIRGVAYVPDETVAQGMTTQEQLATQRVELPTAIHEQIRNEKVTEIQPVVNVEKDFTHIIQKTQPLIDKEIRAVQIEERTLPTQMLPQLNHESKSVGIQRDVSSVDYLQEKSIVIEKPAVYNEVDKTRVIEEIQPVIYKETIIPEVLRETKPSFQRIIEGTTYSTEVLPPIQLRGSNYSYPTQTVVQQPPVIQPQPVITRVVEEPVITRVIEQPVIVEKIVEVKQVPLHHHHHHPQIIEEKTTTTTVVNDTIPPLQKM